MPFHGCARKKLWSYGLSWQQHRATQNCACCLMWQWHGSILSPGRASLLPANSHAWFSVRCFSAVGKVLFVISRPVLGPLANHSCFLCWDWEIWCLLSLAEGCCYSLLNCFSHMLIFTVFWQYPAEGFPHLHIPVPLADPSMSPNWPSTSIPHADADNLTWADAPDNPSIFCIHTGVCSLPCLCGRGLFSRAALRPQFHLCSYVNIRVCN